MPGRPAKLEEMTQMNIRVPVRMRDRARILATRDNCEISQVFVEGLRLYEREYGAAPDLTKEKN